MDIKGLSPAIPSTFPALEEGRLHQFEALIEQGDLKKASQEFEAYFLSYLYKVMQKSVPKNSFLQSRGEEIFRDLYADAIGKQAAEIGGFGLAQFIESSLRTNMMGDVQGRKTG